MSAFSCCLSGVSLVCCLSISMDRRTEPGNNFEHSWVIWTVMMLHWRRPYTDSHCDVKPPRPEALPLPHKV